MFGHRIVQLLIILFLCMHTNFTVDNKHNLISNMDGKIVTLHKSLKLIEYMCLTERKRIFL